MKSDLRSFMDLDAWREAHAAVLATYAIVKQFPGDERYALGSQMRRAAVSFTSNIAEGFGRYSKKEKARFYYIAQASAIELLNQLIVAHDVGYIDKLIFQKAFDQIVRAQKILYGLIRVTKDAISNST